MNKNRSQLISLLFLTTFFWAIQTPSQAQTAIIDEIIPATGKVRINRNNMSDYYPVEVGTLLKKGDLIFPSPGTKVRVICPDLSSKPVVPGRHSGLETICPIWKVRMNKAPAPIGFLGGMDNSIPYVILPSNSLIRTKTPTFRWHKIKGATKYTVELRLRNSDQVVWRSQVADNQVVYDGDRLLETGIFYSLTIQADTGESFPDKNKSVGEFIILNPEESQFVEAEVSKITKQNLNPLTKALFLADFYSNYFVPESSLDDYDLKQTTFDRYGLITDAIVVMEDLITQGFDTPMVYRLLGRLYARSGLVNLSIENYQKAIAGATTPESLEQKTLAQYTLGLVYFAIGNKEKALILYEQAKIGFCQLGNKALANFVERQIKDMQSI